MRIDESSTAKTAKTKRSRRRQNSYITTSSDWSFDVLKKFDTEIHKIAQEYNLDTYPNQIEVITAEQMMDAYSSIGMPIGYNHWSFGKQLMNIEKSYKRGAMGLAYELVINSNPCISYLMEENTTAMQALVIAHACYGHNSFFKGNYMFQSWTSADTIVDYLLYAKKYIAECEEKYGIDKVEEFLDSCHALRNYGVDRYKKPQKLSIEEEKIRQAKRAEYLQSQVNQLWRTLPNKKKDDAKNQQLFLDEPEENILAFLEQHAPLLEPWQREIIRIVRNIAQYFYPQRQTKVMNEGWACFWHYTIMNTLYERRLINEQFMLEFIHSHTSVIYQPAYDSQIFGGINPYALGYNMFMDIKRICQQPTVEDEQWFPEIAGSDWQQTLDFAMRNFKDESFISQFLSPKVIRDMKLFAILDDEDKLDIEVSDIHNELGYQQIRQLLSKQFNLSFMEPNIQVYNIDSKGDRSLTLRYTQQDNVPIDSTTAQEVLKHLYKIWGFNVKLETCNENGVVAGECFCCPKV